MAIAEFIVSGIPISTQASSRSKTRWKGEVAAAALSALSRERALVADPVRVTIVYFYVSTDLDLDNIIKPIVDALKGVVYIDDFQVVNISAAKRDLSGTLVLTDAPPSIIERLAVAADNPQDFVFVAVEPVNMATLL